MPVLLRGGLVADGIAATTFPADILTDGPLIAAVGRGLAAPAGCQVTDLAPGSVICPGFIDAHAHAEGPLLSAGRVDGALAQGVTTLVVGQDGQSWIGASRATADYLSQYFGPVNGALEPPRDFSVADFGAAVSGRLAQNVAVLASQGTIRHNVAGPAAGPLAPAELTAARRQVEAALADGAVGLSSGLDYLPSRLAGVEEMAAVAAPLAAAGRPYVSHLRGYGPEVGAGLAELVAVGRRAGTGVHASHLWGTQADITAAFDAADAARVPLTYDSYPYRRSSSILAMLVLPAGLQAGGTASTLAALADPRQRAALLATRQLSEDALSHVYLGCLPDSAAGCAGLTVAEAARRAGRGAGEWALDLLASSQLGVGAHLDRPGLSGADIAWLASGARQCAGSDGIYAGQHPHPRGYGAFARLAAHYLAAGPEAGYQQAARHLAAHAADVYGLRQRGRIAPGLAADLCVIGPGGLAERATYASPREPAAGVDLVLVAGEPVWRAGAPVPGRLPGRLIST
ncbi:MAG TPA: amidohydrolase family protein [Streptosporangiaceae bacterium]|nr:amidohydrolase family protein [Streptosporangiaceae bacterium]